jgi:perosamine synthetase
MPETSQLAIHGGTPVLPNGPPSWPLQDEAIQSVLQAAYADGSWGRYLGPHGETLQSLLCKLCDTTHAWLCSSGTIAVELALRGLKVGSGDEVILAAYDFPGNFRAIEAVGAHPVLIDLAPGTWTLNVEHLPAALTPQTKAVIVSHLHGSLADMPRLKQIATQHNLQIVEDACQTPGAIIAGRPAGSWGDCGVLSFGGSKLLTAGRGGAVLTSRDDVLQRIKIHCERGNDAYPAVLAPQIPRLAEQNALRLKAVKLLLAELPSNPRLIPLRVPTNGDIPSFYKLPWLLAGNSDACDSPDFEQLRRQFVAAVRAEGVALDEGFRGFARRTNQRCRLVGNLSNARQAAAGTVILHHPVLLQSNETLHLVAQAINKVSQSLLPPKC